MKTENKLTLLLVLLLSWLPWSAYAEKAQDFGDYVVHFNALPTDFLAPEVAQAYRITRSKNRAMLTITVMKKVLETGGQPVPAKVTASAINLTGQLKTIPMREIRDSTAIYYVGELRVADGETLDFKIDVRPEGAAKTYTVQFRQAFYGR